MEGEFPYLKITKELRPTIGEPDEDTRVFRFQGEQREFIVWLRVLKRKTQGDLIPATWVPLAVGVSRTAFHKRVNSGRLTMFVFEYIEREKTLLGIGKSVSRKKGEYAYCVLSECDAWREEIAWREERRKRPDS